MILRELFGKHVRLGNFLFQYAANIKLCSVHNTEAWYPDYYLWQYLEKPPFIYNTEPLIDKLIRPWKWEWTQEEEDYINSLDYTENISFALNHFMQSDKWFKNYEQQVIDSLRPRSEIYSSLLEKHKHLFKGLQTIGLGIRLGDFKNHGTFFQIPYHWYIKALDNNFPNWRKDYQVVVFSDDILEAKKIFKDYPFYFMPDNDTSSHRENFRYYHGDASEQFFVGTILDNFICGNSTFTWWQSYIATYNKPGKVVHCGEVFSKTGNMKDCDISNYYPETWIKEPIS